MFDQEEYIKKWKAEHVEHLRKYFKRYYAKHKEALKKYQRDHYQKRYKNCVICGSTISMGKYCDKCALDTTKVSRQVAWLRRKKLESK